MAAVDDALELWQKAEGEERTGDWFEVTQDQIDQFADVTHDHQFIHVDPERAKDTPFGSTIAHGFLTLSMLTHLSSALPPEASARYAGVVMGINYGFDKVRFVNPVKVGSKLRAHTKLSRIEFKEPSTIQTTSTVTVEIEGEEKPALVADWVTRSVYG